MTSTLEMESLASGSLTVTWMFSFSGTSVRLLPRSIPLTV